MTGPDDELAELFRDEATRRIDAMDAALLEIEAGTAGAETVTGLFREAHTIKGAAGMVGQDDIRVVAHAVEDILAVLRDQGSFPPSLVPGLLRATGLMRTQVAGPGPPPGPVLDELAAARAALTLQNGTGHGTEPALSEPALSEPGPIRAGPIRAGHGRAGPIQAGRRAAVSRRRPDRPGGPGAGREDRPDARPGRRGGAEPPPPGALGWRGGRPARGSGTPAQCGTAVAGRADGLRGPNAHPAGLRDHRPAAARDPGHGPGRGQTGRVHCDRRGDRTGPGDPAEPGRAAHPSVPERGQPRHRAAR